MDDLSDYCFRLSRSQGMSDFRKSRVNYNTMFILIVAAPSSLTSGETRRVIWMPLDGVLLFQFHINIDKGYF